MNPLILIVATFTIFVLGSCDKQTQSIEHETTIEIIQPYENQTFTQNDTIQIEAFIQSNVSMHGYEVLIQKGGETKSLKSRHTHNKTFEVRAEWIVDTANLDEVTIEVIANIDHENTKQSKNIVVKIN